MDRLFLGLSVLHYTLSMVILKWREFHLGFFEVEVREGAPSASNDTAVHKRSWIQTVMKALGTSSRISMRVRGHVTRAIMNDMLDDVSGTQERPTPSMQPPRAKERMPNESEPEEDFDSPYVRTNGPEDEESDHEVVN